LSCLGLLRLRAQFISATDEREWHWFAIGAGATGYDGAARAGGRDRSAKPPPLTDDCQRLRQRHIKGDRYQNGAKKIGKLLIKPNFSTG